jgi:hypothetical protein
VEYLWDEWHEDLHESGVPQDGMRKCPDEHKVCHDQIPPMPLSGADSLGSRRALARIGVVMSNQ